MGQNSSGQIMQDEQLTNLEGAEEDSSWLVPQEKGKGSSGGHQAAIS